MQKIAMVLSLIGLVCISTLGGQNGDPNYQPTELI